MCNRDIQFAGGNGTYQRRIGIAIDEEPVRSLLQQNTLNLRYHSAGFLPMRPTADAKVVVWLGDIKLTEKYARHEFVVMLAGMDDNFGHTLCFSQLCRNSGCLDELGACTYDSCYFRASHSKNINLHLTLRVQNPEFFPH